MTGQIESWIEESIATKRRLLERCVPEIEALCELALRSLDAGGKLMFCGNGGSSCDAAHAAGELVGWFENRDRDGFAAIALGHEVPALTAIGNDASFDQIFARQLRAIGKPEDLLVGISTSGGSKNVVAAMRAAKELGCSTAALVSERGGPVADLADVAVRVPSTETPRIQESHLLVLHAMCASIEQKRASR
ncbi:MAG: SIS domain-containing protein [Planctomycetes bacterium]|nr:SIS domain-containing protein [Planctomycetota bacterium]